MARKQTHLHHPTKNVTMTLPFRLLFILLIKRLTIDGAWRGIKAYWDLSNCDDLSESTIWNAAVGQCFFSLSICMCVMTAYGSGNPRRQDIATAEKVIAFLDVFASLMSGFGVPHMYHTRDDRARMLPLCAVLDSKLACVVVLPICKQAK
eukprot:616404_1